MIITIVIIITTTSLSWGLHLRLGLCTGTCTKAVILCQSISLLSSFEQISSLPYLRVSNDSTCLQLGTSLATSLRETYIYIHIFHLYVVYLINRIRINDFYYFTYISMVSNLLQVYAPTFWTTWKGSAWTTSCWHIVYLGKWSISPSTLIDVVKAPASVDRKLGNFLAQPAWRSSKGSLGHALIKSFITLLIFSSGRVKYQLVKKCCTNAKILICSKIPFLESLEIWSWIVPDPSMMVSSLESRLCLGRWNTRTPPSTPPRTPPHTSPPSPPG